jgi:hypothetical protein
MLIVTDTSVNRWSPRVNRSNSQLMRRLSYTTISENHNFVISEAVVANSFKKAVEIQVKPIFT